MGTSEEKEKKKELKWLAGKRKWEVTSV
jgi:hypothetical protein